MGYDYSHDKHPVELFLLSFWNYLDEQVKVTTVLVRAGGRVAASDFLAVDFSHYGNVLADGQTEDGIFVRKGKTIPDFLSLVKKDPNAQWLLATHKAVFGEMTIFSTSLKFLKFLGSKTAPSA